ncbi:hypothetical protein A3N57_01825 [Enterobacter cloacae subsp. dissolvens]|uniref:acyltransferase family protein n=1 Tax=Enterobacter cloacae TaxID=550 RepID=UPI0007B3B613|nr:acyltransferase [Enterobacter cloacae]KZQ41912.1 hypothetical protein A3N57_01825 [Enterobacter cloacae subsp. dissolvens]HBH7063453.1 acyltransferase [Enterobacter cloacae]
MDKKRILFLDYMRIFAFSTVLIGHKYYKDLLSVANDAGSHITIRMIAQAAYDLTVGGAVGVVVFFMISGYIITHVLQSEGTKEFYIKRIFRIYPLYVFAILLEVIVKYFNGIEIPSIAILVPRLLLVGDFFGTPLGLAGVEWTLRIEIMFYAIMGMLRFSGLLSNAKATSFLFLIACLLIANTTPFPVAHDFHNGYFSAYIPFLFAGVIVYYLETKQLGRMLAFFCIAIMFVTHIKVIGIASPRWINSNYAVIGVFVFMVAWIARERFIYHPWCVLLSELTYSIYLFHDWIWIYFKQLSFAITNNNTAQNLIIMTLLFILCYASNKIVERSGVRIGRKFIRN